MYKISGSKSFKIHSRRETGIKDFQIKTIVVRKNFRKQLCIIKYFRKSLRTIEYRNSSITAILNAICYSSNVIVTKPVGGQRPFWFIIIRNYCKFKNISATICSSLKLCFKTQKILFGWKIKRNDFYKQR